MRVVSVIDTIDEDIITEASIPDIPGVKERIEVMATRMLIVETEVRYYMIKFGQGFRLH